MKQQELKEIIRELRWENKLDKNLTRRNAYRELNSMKVDIVLGAATKYAALMPLLERLIDPQRVNTRYITTQIKEIMEK